MAHQPNIIINTIPTVWKYPDPAIKSATTTASPWTTDTTTEVLMEDDLTLTVSHQEHSTTSTRILQEVNGYTMPSFVEDTLNKVILLCFYNNVNISLVGSRQVRDIMPNDWDYAIDLTDKTAEEREKILSSLLDTGPFFSSGSEPRHRDFGKDFMSYTTGLLNLIIFYNKDMYKNYMKASSVVADAQLKRKSERVAVHDYIDGAEDRVSDDDFISLCSGKGMSAKAYKKYQKFDEEPRTEADSAVPF